MAYLGGKATGSDHILKILNDPKYDGMPYIEPFIGYAHILRRVVNKKSYTAYDNNKLLIVLLKYIQKSGNFPNISREQYNTYRTKYKNGTLTSADLVKASFASFTYSYNGKMFGGYTPKTGDRNYPEERKRYYRLLRTNKQFMSCTVEHMSFFKLNPSKKSLIYCDPPYAGTTEYAIPFNSTAFWNKVRSLSKQGHIVIVSEYKAPSDFKTISKKHKLSSVGGKGAIKSTTEKVFAMR